MKKIIPIVLIIVILISCACAKKEGTKEMKVEMKAVAETGVCNGNAFRLWNFDGTQEGFEAATDCITLGDSFITYKQISGSALTSPAGLSVPADNVRTFELRIRTADAAKLTVSWNVTGSGKKTDGSVSVDIRNDGNWHDYQIDMAYQKEWKGSVKCFTFTLDDGASADIDCIRLTGLYIVPFPWTTGNLKSDAAKLSEIKETYGSKYGTVTVGFSAIVQYLEKTDKNGNLIMNGLMSVDYIVSLAKAADMPVMIWLRADPWADIGISGASKKLFDDDNSLMWTQRTDDKRVFRRDETGYRYFTLAMNDIYGNKTPYWTYTEKLLSQCAEAVAKAIEENPGLILGVTTTSEYKFNTDRENLVLDYNPATILEFRDLCREKFGTVEALNAQCGTDFTTWELKSTDMDPSTTENKGGFDAPRILYEPEAFWDLWTEFRGIQIGRAVQKLVDIIGEKLDSKYIYTHQISVDSYTHASPLEAGDASGSNFGTDGFNHELTEEKCAAIAEILGGDVSRTWGVPEWLALNKTEYDETAAVFERMNAYGVKYVCPFNWGSGDAYDFKDSPSEKAVADFVKKQDAAVDLLADSRVVKYTEDTDSGKIFDYSLPEKSWMHSVTLVPASDGCVLPDTVSVSYLKDNKWVDVGTVSVDPAIKSGNVVVIFGDIEAMRFKVGFGWEDAGSVNDSVKILCQ